MYNILVYGPPGVGKQKFCSLLCDKWIKNGEEVFFISKEDYPMKVEELSETLKHASDRAKIIVHSLSNMIMQNSFDEILRFLRFLNNKFNLGVYTLQEGVHSPRIVKHVMCVTDEVIEMKYYDEGVIKKKLRILSFERNSVSEWVNFSMLSKSSLESLIFEEYKHRL